MCSFKILLSCCHISLPYIMGFNVKLIHKKFKPHARTYHVVTVVVFAVLTLCYSIISHTNNFLLSCAHVNTSNLYNTICSLVATHVILGRLEYTIINTQQNLPCKATLTGRTCFTWISLQHHGRWNFVASTDLLVFLDCWKHEQWFSSRCTAGHCNLIEAQEAHHGRSRSRRNLNKRDINQPTLSQDEEYLDRDARHTWHYPELIPRPLLHQHSQRYQPTTTWHVATSLVNIITTYPLRGTGLEVIGCDQPDQNNILYNHILERFRRIILYCLEMRMLTRLSFLKSIHAWLHGCQTDYLEILKHFGSIMLHDNVRVCSCCLINLRLGYYATFIKRLVYCLVGDLLSRVSSWSLTLVT